MIVVADSGPLHYLILLDHADLLHHFYGDVLVPEAVAVELSSPSAPLVVRDWISRAIRFVDQNAVADICGHMPSATLTDDDRRLAPPRRRDVMLRVGAQRANPIR